MNAAHENSDIDLFIITQKNRLWTARIFTTFLLTVLWKRKTAKKHAGQFCLSFFISEVELSLEKIALENDIYLSYWLHTVIPIVNREAVFEKFIEENQAWCEFQNNNYNKKSHAQKKASRNSENLFE